jgi:hypothetical protein
LEQSRQEDRAGSKRGQDHPRPALDGPMRIGFAKSESDGRADGSRDIVIEIVQDAVT